MSEGLQGYFIQLEKDYSLSQLVESIRKYDL